MISQPNELESLAQHSVVSLVRPDMPQSKKEARSRALARSKNRLLAHSKSGRGSAEAIEPPAVREGFSAFLQLAQLLASG